MTVVHGFVSLLALAGHPAVPKVRQRHAALEALREFVAAGLCSPAVPHRP